MERAMCLTVPARVVEVHGNRATIESRTGRREIDVSHVAVKRGDYVLAQAGVAMMTVKRRDAEAMLASWDEIEALDA